MIPRTFKLVAACLVPHFNLLFNRPNAPLSRVVLKKQCIASPLHHTTPIVLASDGGEQANLEESLVLEPKRTYVLQSRYGLLHYAYLIRWTGPVISYLAI